MTDSEILELGREVERSYLPGMQRRLPDGTVRLVTNLEMHAAMFYLESNPEPDIERLGVLAGLYGLINRNQEVTNG
jgi:hypothetical protein